MSSLVERIELEHGTGVLDHLVPLLLGLGDAREPPARADHRGRDALPGFDGPVVVGVLG